MDSGLKAAVYLEIAVLPGEIKVRRLLGGAHCRPFRTRREYAPRAVLVTKEEQRNGTCRRQGLDAYIAFARGSSVSEFGDPKPVRRIRGEPVLDRLAQRVFRAIHGCSFVRLDATALHTHMSYNLPNAGRIRSVNRSV